MLTPHTNSLQFRKADFDKLPGNIFGVYGIWFRRRCVYIGEAHAQPIATRLAQHWNATHNSALADWIQAKGAQLRVSYVAVTAKREIHDLELDCIRKFQPMTNLVGKTS